MVSGIIQQISSFLSDSKGDVVRPVSSDEADLLSNHRRRVVLKILEHSDERYFDVGDLSTMLAEWEFGPSYSSSERQAIYSSLNGTHLPRLDEAGLLEYDRDNRNEVTQVGDIGQINDYLELYPSEESLFPNSQEIHVDVDDSELLTADEGFHILSNDRRRFVIGYMDSFDREEFEFSELYKNLASHELKTEVNNLEPSDWGRYNTNLRQEHMPVLDELNVVKFDGDRNKVIEDAYLETLAKYAL